MAKFLVMGVALETVEVFRSESLLNELMLHSL